MSTTGADSSRAHFVDINVDNYLEGPARVRLPDPRVNSCEGFPMRFAAVCGRGATRIRASAQRPDGRRANGFTKKQIPANPAGEALHG